MVADADDSNDSKRDVWVLGFRYSDERPEKALGRVFGIDSVRARRLVASMPAVVKRGVTTTQAEPIVTALRKMGARVALVPAGSSRLAGEPTTTPSADPAPTPIEDGELGDIESLGIDLGPKDPPAVSAGHPSARDSLPLPVENVSPEDHDPISAAPDPAPTAPKPVSFLEPRRIPKEPELPPEGNTFGTRVAALTTSAAGVAALAFAVTLPGSVLGDAPDLLGAGCASAALGLLLLGVQGLVAAFLFDAAFLKGSAIATALAIGGGVGATTYFVHRVAPTERAQRARAATMQAIREGRLPEAQLFLTEPQARLVGMDRPQARDWLAALYAAGARQIYVMVDYAEAPHRGAGVAILLPLTEIRRNAVAVAVRQQVPRPPVGDGDWWLIPLE